MMHHGRPHERLDEETLAWTGQRDFILHATVVDLHGARSVHADEELLQRLVGVFPTHGAARNVVQNEVPLRREWQGITDLCERQRTPRIGHRVQDVVRHAPRAQGSTRTVAGRVLGCHGAESSTDPRTVAGFPATIAPAGTLLVTTAPAPTIARSPISMPDSSVALAPTDAPARTVVRLNVAGYCLLRGNRSLVNVALGPMKTSSSSVTPSHNWTPLLMVTRSPTTTSFSMNTWSQILQSSPIRAPGSTCAKAQTRVPRPTFEVSTSACGWRKKASVTSAPPSCFVHDRSLDVLVVEQRGEVRTVRRRPELTPERVELRRVDISRAEGNFLRTRDFQSLPSLDRFDEARGVLQGLVCPCVQPCHPPTENLDVQRSAAQVFPVDVGDLVFAAGRRFEVARDVEDGVVVEVESRHGKLRARADWFLFQPDDPTAVIDLGD